MNIKTFDTNERTQHGENIANDIQQHDAYGDFDVLTAADLWNILDNLQTHWFDHEQQELAGIVTQFMREVEKTFPDARTV